MPCASRTGNPMLRGNHGCSTREIIHETCLSAMRGNVTKGTASTSVQVPAKYRAGMKHHPRSGDKSRMFIDFGDVLRVKWGKIQVSRVDSVLGAFVTPRDSHSTTGTKGLGLPVTKMRDAP